MTGFDLTLASSETRALARHHLIEETIMTISSVLRPLLITAFLSASAHVCAANLIETATAAGSFKTFLAGAKAAGLTDALQTQGPFTVFAPSDAAFAELPTGTLTALLKDKVRLAQLLAHHIVPGKIMVAEVKPGPLKTIQGDPVVVTSDNGKVTIDGANVTQSDLTADNGVIQAIDKVILTRD